MIGVPARIEWFAMEFRAHISWPTLNQAGSFVRRPTTIDFWLRKPKQLPGGVNSN